MTAIARIAILVVGVVVTLCGNTSSAADRPNIVVILADDLGYGDVGCYNDRSKIPTPHLDRFAKQGMRFTDAHSASTVCTPSRYSLLTGRMCFRTGFRGVFTGVDGPLIEKNRLTLPRMLKNAGYATACIGKWHVGMTFFDKAGKPVRPRGGGVEKVRQVDFNRPIKDGPIDAGFDYFFGTACCPTTDWLYAYIENKNVTKPPTELVRPTTKHWLEYEHFRTGLKSSDFEFRDVDLKFLQRSRSFLKQHVAKHPKKPFFLYHATQSAHLPSLPAKQFIGKTKTGPYGDFVFEFDHIVGDLLKTLDELGQTKNTLVVVTSDNGPEIVVTHMKESYGHESARPWRGFKRDNWEGGHRVPFVVRWPGHVKPGTVNAEPICLTDIMATCAQIIGVKLPTDAAEDSVSLLPALRGKSGAKPSSRYVLHQTMSLAMGIRHGRWKLLDHRGSGGNDYRYERLKPYAIKDTAPKAIGQLYDLGNDPGETRNLYEKQPGIVRELRAKLTDFKKQGLRLAKGNKSVSWLKSVTTPPKVIPNVDTGTMRPLLRDADGQPITKLADWKKKRATLRAEWLKYLGPMPEKRPAVKLTVLKEDHPKGVLRKLVRYEAEAGQSVEGYLLMPDDLKPGEKRPGIVGLHPTTTDTIDAIAGLTGPTEKQFGLQFARRGYVVFCPRNYLWQSVKNYREAVDRFQKRHPKTLGMHKMLFDAMRGVDVLVSLPNVDSDRIGAVGHSLGAKETLYLMAFDDRVKVGVASEGGTGFRSTNWDAPWYLGKGIYEKSFTLNHHELLAMIAPRPFLILAGERGRGAADGDRSWPFVIPAQTVYRVYDKPITLGIFNHGKGHAVPPEAHRRLVEWMEAGLRSDD